MQGKLRHAGMTVQPGKLEETVRFYQWFGLRVLSRSVETWNGKRLEVVKMTDGKPGGNKGRVFELIEGDWRPHVAITVTDAGACNKVWAQWVKKVGDPIAYKAVDGVEVMYVADPSGNWVEVVNERQNHR